MLFKGAGGREGGTKNIIPDIFFRIGQNISHVSFFVSMFTTLVQRLTMRREQWNSTKNLRLKNLANC